MSSSPHVQEILILEPDRLCAAVLANSVHTVFPDVILHCEADPNLAAVALAERQIDLFVATLRGFDLDIMTLLGVWADQKPRRTRVLVVTPNADSVPLAAVRALPISGIFHWNEGDLGELESALRIIASGSSYWSRPHHHPELTVRFGDSEAWTDGNRAASWGTSASLPPWLRRLRAPRW